MKITKQNNKIMNVEIEKAIGLKYCLLLFLNMKKKYIYKLYNAMRWLSLFSESVACYLYDLGARTATESMAKFYPRRTDNYHNIDQI